MGAELNAHAASSADQTKRLVLDLERYMITPTTRSIVAAFVLTVMQITIVEAQTPAPAATAQSQQLLKAEELDQLVAPIALYPDALLAEVLMASTYPLEIVQADRWATENKALKDAQLKAAGTADIRALGSPPR